MRATAKAARAMVEGARRTTAGKVTTVVTVTPNGNEDSEDGNSKNNNKSTMAPTATTEGGEHCQSCRDNRGGGHRRPWDATIALTAATSRHAFVGSCHFPCSREVYYTMHGNT